MTEARKDLPSPTPVDLALSAMHERLLRRDNKRFLQGRENETRPVSKFLDYGEARIVRDKDDIGSDSLVSPEDRSSFVETLDQAAQLIKIYGQTFDPKEEDLPEIPPGIELSKEPFYAAIPLNVLSTDRDDFELQVMDQRRNVEFLFNMSERFKRYMFNLRYFWNVDQPKKHSRTMFIFDASFEDISQEEFDLLDAYFDEFMTTCGG